jgi:hypothetical protein
MNRQQGVSAALLILCLAHPAKPAAAQTIATRIPAPVQTASGPIYAYVDLHDSLLYAGNENALITIYVERLELADFLLDENHFTKKSVSGPLREDFSFEDGRTRKSFECHFRISEKAAPRWYHFKLLFSAPAEVVLRPLDLLLPIGVRTDGGLRAGDLSHLSNAEPYDLGQPIIFSVPLINVFENYAVRIHRAKLNLEDAALWDSTRIVAPNDPIPALDENSALEVYLYPKKLSLWSLLAKWDGETGVTISMDYDDGHGRLLRDLKIPLPIKLAVDLKTLLLFVIAGGLLGGFLHVTYLIWTKQKKTKDAQHVIYLCLAVLLGCAAFFIAFLGEIKIEALEVKADPRLPIVAFVIGLLSGVKGPALLIKYIPQTIKSRSGGDEEDEEKLSKKNAATKIDENKQKSSRAKREE